MADAIIPDSSATNQTPPPAPRKRRLKPLRDYLRWVIGVVLVAILAYVYVGGNYGLYRIWRLKQQKTRLERDISALEARRYDLVQELTLLKKNPVTDPRLRLKLERLAREEYGMVRKDEMVYRFVPTKKGKE
ncbi:MAG: septum formation initiator family protein [Candidatus Latescibacteria bacterium]|nr:septum formation initiator family protein [Candidatus Latescibacterota bacterium]